MNLAEEYGHQFKGFLEANREEPFTRIALLEALNVRYRTIDDDTFQEAMNIARILAAVDGNFIPAACPANGQTYRLTSDSTNAIDPSLHLIRVSYGVKKTHQKHVAFIEECPPTDPPTRSFAQMIISAERRHADMIGHIDADYFEQAGDLISVRRSLRS